jgi:hypothetical protein
MIGSEWLSVERGVYKFTENLSQSATTTQQINVQASLMDGIAKIDYHISIAFLADGYQVESKSLTLTVQR